MSQVREGIPRLLVNLAHGYGLRLSPSKRLGRPLYLFEVVSLLAAHVKVLARLLLVLRALRMYRTLLCLVVAYCCIIILRLVPAVFA
jgi:hypothetical protein